MADDPSPRGGAARRHSWIIWYAVVVHLWWGATLILIGPQGDDYHGGVFWNVFLHFGGREFWGWGMILAAVLAAIGMMQKPGVVSFALALPQQAALTVGAFGIVTAYFGFFHYYEESRVLRVLPTALGAFIFHTFALIEIHYPTTLKKLTDRVRDG